MKTLRCAKNPRPATAYIIVWLRRVHSIRKGRRLVRYYQKGSGKPAKQPENSHALTAWKSYRTGFCIKIYQILLTPVSTRLPIEIVYESYLQLQRQQKEAKNPITDFQAIVLPQKSNPQISKQKLISMEVQTVFDLFEALHSVEDCFGEQYSFVLFLARKAR